MIIISLLKEAQQNLVSRVTLFTKASDFDPKKVSIPLSQSHVCTEQCGQRPGDSHKNGSMRGSQISMKRVVNWFIRNG